MYFLSRALKRALYCSLKLRSLCCSSGRISTSTPHTIHLFDFSSSSLFHSWFQYCLQASCAPRVSLIKDPFAVFNSSFFPTVTSRGKGRSARHRGLTSFEYFCNCGHYWTIWSQTGDNPGEKGCSKCERYSSPIFKEVCCCLSFFTKLS